ncbi:MAG: rod shape-determining protein RodA [Bacteroidota bacterium]
MKTRSNLFAHTDWLMLALYVSLVVFGWINIYAVGYEPGYTHGFFDLSKSAGKQLLWITTSCLLFFIVFFFETRLYKSLAYILYGLSIVLLLAAFFWGVSVGGHQAWLRWGGQPSEVAKLTCALAVAKYTDESYAQRIRRKEQLILLAFVLLPMSIILLQGDLGSSLIFVAFTIVFYRERLFTRLFLSGIAIVIISFLTLLVPHPYMVVGTLSLALILIGLLGRTVKKAMLIVLLTLGTLMLIEGENFLIESVLKPHQQNRIKTLVDPTIDPLGIGWNVTQSKIAIGSGGLCGKGFLQGSQTKYGFVPEQSTDFIFCTIGEEHGWLGALLVIGIFLGLISRMLYIAERQRTRFARVYGYAVASILFFHFMINIGMTIGLMPVIGIPLPFISYGGSALWSFSLMLFLLLKFDSERNHYYSWHRVPSLV